MLDFTYSGGADGGCGRRLGDWYPQRFAWIEETSCTLVLAFYRLFFEIGEVKDCHIGRLSAGTRRKASRHSCAPLPDSFRGALMTVLRPNARTHVPAFLLESRRLASAELGFCARHCGAVGWGLRRWLPRQAW